MVSKGSSVFAFVCFLAIGIAGKSHRQDHKYDKIIRRLIDEMKLKPIVSSEEGSCPSCLHQMHMETLEGRKQDKDKNNNKIFNILSAILTPKNVPVNEETRLKPLALQVPPRHHADSARKPMFVSHTRAHLARPSMLNSEEEEEDEEGIEFPGLEWRDLEVQGNYDHYEDAEEGEDLEDDYYDDESELSSEYSARHQHDSYSDLEYTTFYHKSVCDTKRTWKILNETIVHNLRGEVVQVLPHTHEGEPQYVHTLECANTECKRCQGVHLNSRCRMRQSFVNLYHELDGQVQYGYVGVPTHCTCELLPIDYLPEGCPRIIRS